MRRPRLTAAGAVLVLAVLAALGVGVNHELKATSLSVPGTESSHGAALLQANFGDSAPFAVLLHGPAAELDRQGPRLIEALTSEDPRVTAASPWARGGGLGSLRPNRRTALVLVDFHVSADAAVNTAVPRLRRVIAEQIAAPVTARAAGLATVARAIREESLSTTRRGEIILAPLLLIVLLFVFRSPIAAVIPLVFGATTIVASRGLIAIVAGFVDISAFALSIATMIGLAIGVDYALLIVSRFREELDRGADPAEAATRTRQTAGRTTVFAGSILLIAVLIATCLVPGALLVSLGAAVAPAILVAVAGPWLVGPAVLVLVGRNVDRWRIGGPGPVRTRWLLASRAALRRPGVATLAIGAALLLIALPASALATGPVTIEELARDDPARLDVEAIEAAVGGGWITPAVVVAVDEHAPVTGPRQLRILARWQAHLSRQAGVEAVIGPGSLVGKVAPLRRLGRSFLADGGDRGGSGGNRAIASLSRAHGGLARLRRGLGLASEGARRLTLGGGRAHAGAGLIADGLSLASSGGGRARRALTRFSRGTHALADGERSAGLGVSLLDFSVDELGREVGVAAPMARRMERELAGAGESLTVAEAAAAATVEKLEAAWRELGAMSVGATDPHYAALTAVLREALAAASGTDPVSAASYAPGYAGLPAALAGVGATEAEVQAQVRSLSSRLRNVSSSVSLLRRLAVRLKHGVARLEDGGQRLAGGSDRIVAAAVRLRAGLTRLAGGAERLGTGLARLRDGSERLTRGLSSGFRRTRPLVDGARRAEIRLGAARRRLDRGSPHIFDSGYFTLAALDGAPAPVRKLAGQAISLGSGGRAAKILVVGSTSARDGSSMAALSDRLRASAARLAARSGMQVAVTGGITQSVDYERSTSSRLPPLIVAITVVTFLLMLAVLRALPLAALAITLNLVSVAAAFGVLELLTLLPPSLPFGGARELDPVGAAGIFGVVFGLSIDYAVFLLTRMREGWERDRDNDAAIAYGLERTASVITGAATIMTCVFLIFATAPIQSVAQFGVSLTVAVVLDATAIRLMLVPALMKLIGPRIWWLPAWLDRVLPRLDVDGEPAAPAR